MNKKCITQPFINLAYLRVHAYFKLQQFWIVLIFESCLLSSQCLFSRDYGNLIPCYYFSFRPCRYFQSRWRCLSLCNVYLNQSFDVPIVCHFPSPLVNMCPINGANGIKLNCAEQTKSITPIAADFIQGVPERSRQYSWTLNCSVRKTV